MAYIKPKTLNFIPAPGDGASGYAVYIVPTGDAFDYDDSWTDVGMQNRDIDLAPMVDEDGIYDVYVTAYDDSGNMSDETNMGVAIPFDTTAPLAPLSGSVS